MLGEGLSGSTPPLTLLLPWNLAFMAGLYGCGALLCREVARRAGLPMSGLLLLGAAYGVFEEGIVDRYWFFPTFWHDVGVGHYSVVWRTNVLLATHLTVFHAVVSITCAVVVTERLFPAARDRGWLPGWALGVVAVVLFAGIPFLYGELDRGPDVAHLVVAGLVGCASVLAAFTTRRWSPGVRRPRWCGPIAFACTAAHFVLVYAVPASGLPWPLGVALSLVPVALGVVLVGRTSTGSGPVVRGVLGFFVVLDLVVALSGRYDSAVLAVLLTVALVWWRRRDRVRPGTA